MHNPFLGLLGIARRAGKLAMGHDMVLESVLKGRSCLVLVASDSSERLLEEFRRVTAPGGMQPEVRRVPYAMEDLHQAVGYKAGVFSINDAGFAAKFLSLLEQGTDASGNMPR